MKPLIGMTMGDPAGVGPEIILQALQNPSIHRRARFVVFGHKRSFERLRRFAVASLLKRVIFAETSPRLSARIKFGVPSAAGGRAAGEALVTAIDWAMKRRVDAIVTAPINKDAFKQAGWGTRFPGHTEMLTELTQAKSSALMMVYKQMRAVHVTSHIPLRSVAASLTAQAVFDTISLAQSALLRLGIRRPQIAVCGLNPHAGDNGVLGTEDRRVIGPAVERALKRGWSVAGPMSADIVWPLVWNKQFDVGVAMYHDQGQIPMKLLAFTSGKADSTLIPRGVNVTIGLPIVRTSVAHGTAFEIAGKYQASPASLIDAIELAVQLARHRDR
jgi:4-hydroxythreonine-4-phosphate dehydrogenase